MLELLTRLLLAKPARRATEDAAEATGDAYMDALDDVPTWAVAEAIRHWHRGECGEDHDYTWAPGTATLRRLALSQAFRIRTRIAELTPMLSAEVFVDTREDVEIGKAAMRGLHKALASGDRDLLKNLTFRQAIKLGEQARKQQAEDVA